MESGRAGSILYLTVKGKSTEYEVNEVAHQQIAARLNIPYRYYQKMQCDAPDLLDENVNRWLNQNPERRMIRVDDSEQTARNYTNTVETRTDEDGRNFGGQIYLDGE